MWVPSGRMDVTLVNEAFGFGFAFPEPDTTTDPTERVHAESRKSSTVDNPSAEPVMVGVETFEVEPLAGVIDQDNTASGLRLSY